MHYLQIPDSSTCCGLSSMRQTNSSLFGPVSQMCRSRHFGLTPPPFALGSGLCCWHALSQTGISLSSLLVPEPDLSGPFTKSGEERVPRALQSNSGSLFPECQPFARLRFAHSRFPILLPLSLGSTALLLSALAYGQVSTHWLNSGFAGQRRAGRAARHLWALPPPSGVGHSGGG